MPLPDITHLQYLLLSIVACSEMSGRDIRAELAKAGVQKTGPAFYQLMARLETQGFVEGWYTEKVVHGQRIRERRYKILGLGERALTAARTFYESPVPATQLQGVMARG